MERVKDLRKYFNVYIYGNFDLTGRELCELLDIMKIEDKKERRKNLKKLKDKIYEKYRKLQGFQK